MRNLVLLLICLAIINCRAWSQAQIGWVPFDGQAGVSQQLPGSFLKEESTKGILINFNVPGMVVHETTIGNQIFHKLSIPGHGLQNEIGMPELPIIGQVVEIPLNAQVKIEVYKEKHILLTGYTIYPAQKIRFNQGIDTSEFVIDSALYRKDALYPLEPAIIQSKDIGIIRGHRLLFLKVNPVQYNPVRKELIAYSSIEVRVTYDKPDQVDYVDTRKYSPAFEQLFKSLIINYRDPGKFIQKGEYAHVSTDPSGFTFGLSYQRLNRSDGAAYLIICPRSFYNATDPNNAVARIEKWKKSKGYLTQVVTTNNITDGTTAAGIKAFIQNAYDTWSVPPAYILLIGDSDSIPTNYKTKHPAEDFYHGAKIGTDLYYSTVDGDDYLPDVFIGRISADNINQVNNDITKIINYEKNPPTNDNFYRNILLAGGFEDVNPEDHSNGIEDDYRAWIECLEDMHGYFSSNYSPQRVYRYNGNFANGPQQYENYDDLPSFLLSSSGFNWNGNSADISAAINGIDGLSFIVFRDHGSRDGWGFPNFNNWNISALTNANRSPIIFSIACETGWFDNETDDDVKLDDRSTLSTDESFCEVFTRELNDGTQAIIGASRISYSVYNDFFAFGLLKAVWHDYNPSPTLSDRFPDMPSLSVSSLNRMGQIHNYGKLFLEKSCRDEDEDKIKAEFELFHLFGDPEMIVYSKEPGNLSVNFPAKIGSSGHQHFIINVLDVTSNAPIQGAQVVLLQDNDIIWSDATDPAGNVEVQIFSPSINDIELTVTSDIYRTFEGKISVSQGGGQINRMDQGDAPVNAAFNLGGINFLPSETVDIYLNSILMQSVTADGGGSFGQTGVSNISLTVPSTAALGPANMIAHGRTSDRYAYDVFFVRSPNPIDLLMYSQYDENTWYLHPGDNPVWNNPDICLYVANILPVHSGNLHVGTPYNLRATVRNNTDFVAHNVNVTFSWANYSIGGPFSNIENGTAIIDVPAHGNTIANIVWTPSVKGHICVQAEIYHVEDINTNNNIGQENCTVGKAASPFKTDLILTNPTDKSSYMYLDVRQLSMNNQGKISKFWSSEIEWPEDQLLKPNEDKNVAIAIDPEETGAVAGDKVWFSVTGYIDKEIVGGVDVVVEKRMYKTISLHAGLGFPMRSFADNYKQGYYLKVDYVNPIKNRTYIHFIGGVNTFKAISGSSQDETMISLDAYINRRIYIWRNMHLFVEAGPGFYKSKINGSAAGVSAGLGLALPVTKKIETGISGYYHIVMKPVDISFTDFGFFINYLF